MYCCTIVIDRLIDMPIKMSPQFSISTKHHIIVTSRMFAEMCARSAESEQWNFHVLIIIVIFFLLFSLYASSGMRVLVPVFDCYCFELWTRGTVTSGNISIRLVSSPWHSGDGLAWQHSCIILWRLIMMCCWKCGIGGRLNEQRKIKVLSRPN